MQLEKAISESNRVDYSISSSSRDFKYKTFYVSGNRLVKGNSKLYNILIFDLPAVSTCLNCGDCKDKCYAMKAQRQYIDTRIFRETNLSLYKEYPKILKTLLINQLSKAKESVVRIHSSGDFFSQDYIEFWASIVSMFPNIKFYTYTKVEKILKFDSLTKLENFNLITSIIDNKLNFGSLEYCKELKTMYGSFICPATNYKNVQCGKQCSFCVTKKNVCFVQH